MATAVVALSTREISSTERAFTKDLMMERE
jgi:hypothetical protein